MSEFFDKVVLITGASSGIGEATAEAFAKHGARLSITGRNEKNLNSVAAKCKSLGAKEVLSVISDLENESNVERVVEDTIKTFRKLDVLVNNAGVVTYANLEKFSTEEFDRVFSVNLKAPILLTHLSLPYLEQTKGNIINVSSIGAQMYYSTFLYLTSKAGLDHFTKSSALELSEKGIRVNSVSPGAVPTNIFLKIGYTLEKNSNHWKKRAESLPLRDTNVRADEVADAILFLASDSAKMITGTALPVDGGRLLTGK